MSAEEECFDLAWRDEFGPILAQAQRRMATIRLVPNSDYILVAILTMIQEGRNPTPNEVIAHIIVNFDEPPEGWGGMKMTRWLRPIMKVVNELRSME